MRYCKLFAWCALTVGMAIPGASGLSAADWNARDAYRDRQDSRSGYSDLGHDYARVDRTRDDMARDRTRLNEDIACGRRAAAAEDARDLAHDQQALNAQSRDIQRDGQELRRDDRYGRR